MLRVVFPSLLLSTLTVCAQAPPGALTIEQAVAAAIDKNLSLMAEKFTLSVADARIITARLRPNPVFSAGADYLDVLGTGFNAANAAGPGEVNFRTDFTIERGGKRSRRVDVAQDVRSVAQLQYLNAVRQLVLDVQSAFLDVLGAKENLALAQENTKVWNRVVEVNTARVRAGDLAQVELLRSRVAALQSMNALRQSELRLRSAANHLQLLLGRPTPAHILETGGEPRRDTPALPLEDLRAAALRTRPDLLAQRRDQARAASDVRLQVANGKMDYTVGTQYHRQYDNAKGNALGIFFSVPLPVFNRNQGEIERARQELRQIEARTRASEAVVTTEVDNAYQQYLTAKALLENIEGQMLKQAREVRDITEYSYGRGEASFVEFLDAQRAFNDTMQGYNDARAEYARTLYLLDAVSGKGVNP